MYKELIKANVTMAMVLSWYGLNKRACPFHKDKEGRLKVTDWSFTCHSSTCGKHGNVIDFIMYREGLNFTDACKFICEKFNLDNPKMSHFNYLRLEVRRLTVKLAEVEKHGKQAVFHNRLAEVLGLEVEDVEELRAEYKKTRKRLEEAKKELLKDEGGIIEVFESLTH